MIYRCYLRVRLHSHARQGQTSTHQDFYSITKPLRVLRRKSGRGGKRRLSLRSIFHLHNGRRRHRAYLYTFALREYLETGKRVLKREEIGR